MTWLGASPSSRGLKHLLGFVLPNFANIIIGRCQLIGSRPRTIEEWAVLEPEQQRWLGQKKCGLLQEQWILAIPNNDHLQTIVLERYQQSRSNEFKYKCELIWRYAKKVCSEI
jgi:lipopolysaccharide/colanic/teichoic acid biosynthesis glycosyltransferase